MLLEVSRCWNIVEGFKSQYARDQETELSLEEYLDLWKRDPMAYASPAERMLAAIGEPEIVDTRNDLRLSRLFSNRVIRRYPAFKEFFGMEDVISQIVSFFQACCAGPGRTQADPLSARAGGRREIPPSRSV